jgi:hypothetical protein
LFLLGTYFLKRPIDIGLWCDQIADRLRILQLKGLLIGAKTAELETNGLSTGGWLMANDISFILQFIIRMIDR